VSCDPGGAQDNLARVADVYRGVLARGVTQGELTQAKNKVLSRSVLRSERPMGRLASLGFHWAYRREYLSAADELEAFSRVTVDDVRRVLDRWPLLPMSVVSVGPTADVRPVG
jgi:predicted Zn-dependent peptidase